MLGCVLLTTCGSDSLAPRPPIRGELDLSSLLQLRVFPIPVDQIVIELRRSDQSIAFSQILTPSEFETGSTGYRVPIQVELNESPETFQLHAEVRASSIVYYEVNSTVTATLGRTVTTDPLTPTYVGPGAQADSVQLVVNPASIIPGGTAVATATVWDADAVINAVPVEITSSAPAQLSSAATGFNTATLTATGAATGSYTITARTPNNLTVNAALTVVVGATGADSIAIVAGNNQSGVVNQLVAVTPSVRVLDANQQPLANASVSFTVLSGGGTVVGGTVLTDDEGDAAVGSWRLGQAAGANTLQATVAGVPPVVFTATGAPTTAAAIVKISGDTQTDSAGHVLPLPLIAEVRDTFANPIPGIAYSWSATDGTPAPATGTANGQGRVSATWTLGLAQTSPIATIVAGGVQTSFSATVRFGQPTISLAWAAIPGVGIGLSSTVNVTVNTAPATRIAIAMTSSNTGFFTVAAPDTVYINAGQTTGSKTINGISAGTATLTASAPGYATGTITVDVQNRNISLPTTLNVPYGQTASLPIQLPAPAPVGGVTFAISSNTPSLVGVATPTVTIAAGGQTANATLNGVLPGPATITATNAAYVTGTTAATTTASLNVVQGSVALNTSFGSAITINFESNGTGQAAPAPGISVTLTPRVVPVTGASCVTAQTPRTIPTGQVSVTSNLTYDGTSPLPCSTYVVATATNLQPDSVPITVTAQPGISVTINSGGPIGQRLQESASFNLAASNHGGVNVTLTSSDPAAYVLSTSNTIAGSGTLVMPILPGNSSASFWVQSITSSNSTGTITASATGFTNGSAGLSVVTPGVEVLNIPTSTTTLSAPPTFYVQSGVPNVNNSAVQRAQYVSAGIPQIVVTATSQFTGIATILDSTNSPTGGATGSSTITGGTYYSQGSNPTPYGLAVRPVSPGTDTITISSPGFLTMSNSGVREIAVTQPVISLTSNYPSIGSGLEDNGYVTLSASNHGGATITVTSGDPSKVLLSLNPDSAGTPSISQLIPNGQVQFLYWIQALDGQTAPSVTLTATEARFATGTTNVAVVQPGIELQGVPGTTTTLSGNFAAYAQVGIGNGGALQRGQNRRGGGPPLSVLFRSTDTLVMRIVDSLSDPIGSDTGVARLRAGLYYTNGGTPSVGGIAGRPIGAGPDSIKVSLPGFIPQTSAARGVTVSQPVITINPNTLNVGSGLQESGNVFLSAGTHGGATVTVTSSDPTVMLIDTIVGGVGHASIVRVVPNNQSSFPLYFQAIEGKIGAVTITATEPRFATGTRVMTAVVPGVELQGLPSTLSTLSPNQVFYARVGTIGGGSLNQIQNVRGGAPGPLVATFTATPASIGSIIDSVTPGGAATGTARIKRGLYYTDGSGPATGGVLLHPILNGTVAVTVSIPGFTTATSQGNVNVTISQPGITISGNSPQLGAGLQTSGNGNLGASNHGGVTVTLTSSDPSVLRLAKTAGETGTASIQIAVPNGATNFSFVLSGMEGVTGTPTITATASGFTNGTTSEEVVVPAIEIGGLGTPYTAGSADVPFYAQVGVGNGQGTGLIFAQNVRFGAPSPVTVTFTSSTPGSGTLVTTAGPAASRTAQISPTGTVYYTPTSVSGGGVAFRPVATGQTTVTVGAPGFTPLLSGTRVVNVN